MTIEREITKTASNWRLNEQPTDVKTVSKLKEVSLNTISIKEGQYIRLPGKYCCI